MRRQTTVLVCGVVALLTWPMAARTYDSGQGQPAKSETLLELLARPRSYLAEQASQLEARIRLEEKAAEEGKLVYGLLRDFRLPRATPVFREAQFSTGQGFSLPPYAKEGEKDPALAIHLARFGDYEAAHKLIDSADTATAGRIDALKYERLYPLEWTRLVALNLHAAQLRLAAGEEEGFREFVSLRKQIDEALGAKAAKGPLGSVLIPRGRRTLMLAEAAWRARQNALLADEAAALLARWSKTSRAFWGPPASLSASDVSRELGSQAQGRVVVAKDPLRALDLWSLPVPETGIDRIIASIGEAGALSDVHVLYRTGFGDRLKSPLQLAHSMMDDAAPAGDLKQELGLQTVLFEAAEVQVKVALVGHGGGLGAWVHWTSAPHAPSATTLPRDFGLVDLDHSFEQNRTHLARHQRGPKVSTELPSTLGRLKHPLAGMKPAQASIASRPTHDLIASVRLSYDVDVSGLPPLWTIAGPLWSKFGKPEFQGLKDSEGDYLALEWADMATLYRLRLPYDAGKAVVFEAADRHSAGQLARLQEEAHRRDQAARRRRLEGGNAHTFLPREWEGIELGSGQNQALEALPKGPGVLKRNTGSTVLAVSAADPAAQQPLTLRQWVMRFDTAQRLVELRCLYTLAGDGRGGQDGLIAKLKKAGGAPLVMPAPNGSLWTDATPAKTAPSLWSWQDDRTRVTLQTDGNQLELCFWDRPADHAAGNGLPALQYLPRGLRDCELGLARKEILRRPDLDKPTPTEDGALLLRPGAAEKYDAVLTWYAGESLSRIVARQREAPAAQSGPAQWGQSLAAAWGRELAELGWPHRQEFAQGDVLQCLMWQDGCTRIRMFWQEQDDGSARLFTEWTDLAKR